MKIKAMNIRLPEEHWRYLRNLSTDVEKSMNEIIIALIINHKNNSKKLLTNDNAMVP
jgi:predicted DNA-binding protein